MKGLLKIISLIITAILVFAAFINMSDGDKPAVPYEARKGVDPDWPKKREAFYNNYCAQNTTEHFCELRAKK